MEQLILIAHLLIALAIIGLIMLQQGKGAEMGASFGAGASQTLLGTDGGGNILTKATAFLVVAFFATSFGLALVAKNAATAVDDGGLGFPMVQQAGQQLEPQGQVGEQEIFDLPAIEEEIPESATAGDDIPELD